jgi:hypothetical protein
MSPLLESIIYIGGGLLVGWFARHRGVMAPAPVPVPAPAPVELPSLRTGRPLLDALLNKLHGTLEDVVDDLLKGVAQRLAPGKKPPE